MSVHPAAAAPARIGIAKHAAGMGPCNGTRRTRPPRRKGARVVAEVHYDAVAISAELTELRRAIHREPEIGFELPRTQEKVLAALDGLPLEVTRGRALTSVTAVLRGARPGPTVLLRGDMDALPVAERTGLDYASRVDGVMHACGHDLHTAMLAGAARLLAAR